MTQNHPNPVLDFMLTRRSRPAAALKLPAPDAATLEHLLTAATRVPDHGKLEPWRFLIIDGAARQRLSDLILERGPALTIAPEKIEKAAKTWANAPLIVAVVLSPKPSENVPEIEQLLSAGAVCLSLVNAALASGWGAAWITGWAAFDRAFLETGLGLQPHEQIAGFVHLGSCDTPVTDRPRPDVSALIQRLDT
ncbi:nitroreductase [Pararhodobacter sp.]|uniref:nitroreductase family protein n=1 Tax=Pararhodobacter sp. TaxID=2127056 RepID=UPI002AFF3731|nr:nitroreductase [Pararhodobacter sp.]